MLFDKNKKSVYKGYLLDFPEDFLKYLNDMNRKGYEYIGNGLFTLKFKRTDKNCKYDIEYWKEPGIERKQQLEDQHFELINTGIQSAEKYVYCSHDVYAEPLEFNEEYYKNYLNNKYNSINVTFNIILLIVFLIFAIHAALQLMAYPVSMYFYAILSEDIDSFNMIIFLMFAYNAIDNINATHLIRTDRFNFKNRKILIYLKCIIFTVYILLLTVSMGVVFLIGLIALLAIILICSKINNKIISTAIIIISAFMLFAYIWTDSDNHDKEIADKFETVEFDIWNETNNFVYSNDNIDYDSSDKSFNYIHVNIKSFDNYIIHSVISDVESDYDDTYTSYETILKKNKHGEIDGVTYLQTKEWNYVYKDNILYYSYTNDYSIEQLMDIYEKY